MHRRRPDQAERAPGFAMRAKAQLRAPAQHDDSRLIPRPPASIDAHHDACAGAHVHADPALVHADPFQFSGCPYPVLREGMPHRLFPVLAHRLRLMRRAYTKQLKSESTVGAKRRSPRLVLTHCLIRGR